MNSFLTNLVLRGAGLPPLPVAQPPATPLLALDLGAETRAEADERPSTSHATVPTRPPHAARVPKTETAVVPHPAPSPPDTHQPARTPAPPQADATPAQSAQASPTVTPSNQPSRVANTTAPTLASPAPQKMPRPQPQPAPLPPLASLHLRSGSPLAMSAMPVESSEPGLKAKLPETAVFPAPPPTRPEPATRRTRVDQPDITSTAGTQNATSPTHSPTTLVHPAPLADSPVLPSPPPTQGQNSARQASSATVSVQIGTIEVRGNLPPPPLPTRSAPKPQGFSRYTTLRGGEGA